MQLIAQNNNFRLKPIQNRKQRIWHKRTRQEENDKNQKWVTFIYYSPRVRKITNLFKHTNIGIALKTTYTIQRPTSITDPAVHRNSKRALHTSLHVMHVKWHTSDKTSCSQTKIPGAYKIYHHKHGVPQGSIQNFLYFFYQHVWLPKNHSCTI